ncbi:MAG: transposase [Chloroflexi bacterium]|nr:transposase [Chloroflexota bacterium]
MPIYYDPQKHHRRSIRLKGYDYTQPGAYFITLVAHQHEMLFGEVVDGEMILSEYGRIVAEEWERTALVRPYVQLDEFVVMPNHIHGIVWIVDDAVGATRRVAPTANGYPTGLVSKSLGAIVAQFKSIVTKRIAKTRGAPGTPVWQRNYWEHIIRNEAALDRIREYILTNPLRWVLDRENPDRQGEDDFDRWLDSL